MRFFLVVILFVVGAQCDSVFRFGAVLSTTGMTKSMAEAKNGFELYFEALHERHNGRGFRIDGKPGTQGYNFTYAFLWRDDLSDPELHSARVTELIQKDKVHFLGGSHTKYAPEEMRLANRSGVLLYQCCVESDIFSQNTYSTVFAITASDAKFAINFLTSLFLSEEKKRVSIVYDGGAECSTTTCMVGQRFFQLSRSLKGFSELVFMRACNVTLGASEFFKTVAKELKMKKVDAMLACVSLEDGKHLIEALHEAQYSLKSTFITRGPADQNWVDSFNDSNRVEYLMSAAQWNPRARYKDEFFGSTAEYAELYRQRFGSMPTSHSAGATAVGLTLTPAIQRAFRHCDISKTQGDVDALLYDPDSIQCDYRAGVRGYDLVMEELAETDMDTFFGKVKFDNFRRNKGLQPVTTQVILEKQPDGTEKRQIEAVMPVYYASRLSTYPAKNYYKKRCSMGYFVGPDDFNPCVPCPKGEMSDTVNSKHCDCCPIGEWNDRAGQWACQRCPEGTSTGYKGARKRTDCLCKPGYYNIAGLPGVACEPCPVGATCAGGIAAPVPLPGYWANQTRRSVMYPCSLTSICKGGPEVTCEKGHTGRCVHRCLPSRHLRRGWLRRLCAQCEPDHFSALQKCRKCVNGPTIVLLLVALLVVWYVINVTVSRSVGSLEMLLGWAQLANIIGDINLNWTSKVTTVFGVANLLDFDIDILEPSCLVPWGFRENFITQLLLPFVMSTMAASGYLGSAITYQLVQRNWIRLEGQRKRLLSIFVKVPEDKAQLQAKWDATIATFLASVDVTYVTIAKYCFDVFKCEPIAGVSVLREAPDVLCGTTDHDILIVLSAIGIAFYVVGYLGYVFWKLYDLSDRRAFSNITNLRRFGFVYEKFELDYYFTPAIILVRKLLFVLILVYVNSPAFQIGAIAIVINASMMLHVYTAPYVDTNLDFLYSFLLLALMFVAFGGLMFYSDNLPDENRNLLENVVVYALLVLVIFFFAILAMEMIKKFHVHSIKAKQLSFAKRGLDPKSSFISRAKHFQKSLQPSASLSSLGSSVDDIVSFELLETFHPAFVYKSINAEPDSIKDWDTLTNLLKDYMSDQSETSYLSMEPIAKFWRKLVDRFPELVDFLAVADEDTREKFKDVATSLYRNFYLTNKVTPLPLMDVLNWRDYAPMAQWLAIAPQEQRAFFLDVVAGMFKNNGNEEAAEILALKTRHGGLDPDLQRRLLRKGTVPRAARCILNNINEGSHPFHHPASDRNTLSSSIANLRISEYFDGLDESKEHTSATPNSPVAHEIAATAHVEIVQNDATLDSAWNNQPDSFPESDPDDPCDDRDSQ